MQEEAQVGGVSSFPHSFHPPSVFRFVRAVTIIGRPPKECVLTVQRYRARPGPELPGGKIELGENRLQALSREVQEEAGLIITDWTILNPDQAFLLDLGNQVWFGTIAFARLSCQLEDMLRPRFCPKARPDDSASLPRWSPYRELLSRDTPSTPPSFKVIMEAGRLRNLASL